VNPSPAFTYYQQATGQPIAAAIARLLTAAPAAPRGIYMKLSVDSLHQCDGFVLFCQTFSEDLSRGVSFS